MDGDYRHQVVLNWSGPALEKLDFYAQAYHQAARALARRYSAHTTLRDFAGCPIVFLYRHALELYLKAFLLSGDKLLRIQGKPGLQPDPLLCGHRLMALLPGFERVVKELHWGWDMGVDGLRSRRDFVDLLQELDAVDENSFSFRYPIDKKGKPSLPRNFRFSVKKFAKRMDALLKIVSASVMGSEAAYEAEYEMSQDARGD